MAAPRAEACSVRFPDGRVLVAGGRGEAGALNSAELYSADGTFSATSPMDVPRASASCALLQDGRVLVAGGNNGGGALRSAEIFDAASNSWTSAGDMTSPRSGHTATQHPWGAILLIGGDEAGTVEAYLTNGRFAGVGKLSVARSEYAVTRLNDNRIMISGGNVFGRAVATVDIFDPTDLTTKPAADMLAARRSLAAAALYDGTVMLIGGYDVKGMPLSSTEIYDPAKGVSTPGPELRNPRAGHEAYLLPNNGKVLIAGGVDASGPLAAAEVYTPWTRTIESTGSMRHGRANMSASWLRRGGVVVAGGKEGFNYLGSSEVYNFATVETDQLDYAPGSVASITGHGWKPGETVMLSVSAFPLDRHRTEFTGSAVADGNGEVRFPAFHVDASHLDVRFMATAFGSESQAQTLFTDSNPDTTQINVTVNSATNAFGVSPTFSGHVQGGTVNPVTTGSVTLVRDGFFTVNSVPTILDPLTGNYSVTISSTQIPPGLHSVAAAYSGGTSAVPQTWIGSNTTTPVSYTVTVATTTTLNIIPSSPQPFGTSLTLNASIAGTTPLSGSPNSGNVTFVDAANGNAVIGGGAVPVVSGAASLIVNNLLTIPNPHSIVAQYVNPIPGYQNSNSAPASFVVFPATPQSQITFSPAPPYTVGQTITIIFTITTVGGVTPTGNATFRVNGSPVSGAIPLASGQASFAYGGFRAGIQNVTVSYSGDVNYDSLLPSPITTIPVGKANVTTSVTTAPPSPVTFGIPVTLNGAVLGPNLNVPVTSNTNATFNDTGVAVAGAANLNVVNGAVSAAIPGAVFHAGSHILSLHYGPADPNYNASPPGAEAITTLVVNAAVPADVLTSLTPTTNLDIGNSITFRATLTSPNAGSGPAPGTVTFFDSAVTPITGCIAISVSGAGPVIADCNVTFAVGGGAIGAGAHSYTATYNPGNTDWGTTTSNAIAFTVTPQTPTVGPVTFTAPSPIVFGQADTINVTFTPPSPAPLTGTVQFFDGLTLVDSKPVVSGGNTQSSGLTFSLGSHSITATYSGDVNYKTVTGGPATLVVNKGNTTTSSTVPPVNQTYGSTVNITLISVVPVAPAVGTPTGTVTVALGVTTLCTVVLPANSCSFNSTALSQGGNTITTSYPGDANFNSSSTTGTITLIKANSTAAIVTNPLTTVAFGAPLTLTATIASTTSGTPTGTVDFYDGVTKLNGAGVTLVAGVASFNVPTPLGPGLHSAITVKYAGDANFNAAPDGVTSITVGPASTTTLLSVSNASPTLGQTITFTATVTPAANAPAPVTGNVSFADGANALPCSPVAVSGNPATAVCTHVLNGTTPTQNGGPHSVTATFNPSPATTWSSSVSSATAINVAASATTISTPTSSATATYNYGTMTTFSAAVSPHPAAPAFTGTVQFFDNGAPIGGAIVPDATTGLVTTGSLLLTAGTHPITARFLGDANYTASSISAALTVTVSKVTPPLSFFGVPVPVTPAYAGLLTTGRLDVTFAPSNGVAPTGTLTLFTGGTQLGVVTLGATPADGSAHATFTNVQLPNSVPAGPGQNLTVVYNGDGNYNGTTLSTTSLTVNAAAATAVVTLAPTNPVYGQSLSFTATFTGPGNPVSGSVDFRLDGNNLAGCTSVPVTNGVALCPVSSATNANGFTVGVNHSVTIANLALDANHTLGAVTPTPTFVVGPAVYTSALTASTTSPTIGQAVTLTVTLTPQAPGSSSFLSTSTVTINGLGAANAGCTNIPISVTLGVGTATCSNTFSTGGTFNLSAVFNPVNNTLTAANALLTETVGGGSAPLVTVASNQNPSVFGQAVTFTATIAGSAPLPTGTATFFDAGVSIGSATVASVGGVAKAALTVSSLSAGSHAISVTYNGDTNYSAGSTAAGALTQTVNKAGTSNSLSSVVNGANVTFTSAVTVTAPGAGSPTGTVQFINTSSAPQTVLGTSPLVAGTGTFTAQLTIATPAGNPAIIARYSGDGSFLGSDSPPANLGPQARVVITSDVSPSTVGTQVTFSIAVQAVAPATGTPTGQIEIFDGVQSLGIFTLQGGQFSFSTSALAVGFHTIGVTYKGDATFQPVSSSISQLVNKISTSISLSSSAASVTPGQSITFTAVLSSGGTSLSPTGQVSFFDGAALLGTAGLQSNVATLTVSSLAVGPHSITAQYSGDGNFQDATSNTWGQTVTSLAAQMQIASSANPSVFGQSVTFTVTVTGPGSAGAQGQVQLSDNGTALTSGATGSNGQFTFQTAGLAVGTHTITAQFSGGSGGVGNASATLTQVVNRANTATSLSLSSSGSGATRQLTLTAGVSVSAPGAGSPTGSVQFFDSVSNQVLGTATLVAGGGGFTAVLTITQPNSSLTVTASYSGDSNFAPSTSTPVGQGAFVTQISAVNGASFAPGNLARDSWVSIFGDNLSSGSIGADTIPYPTILGGTRVQIIDANGVQRLAPLYFVSPRQINLLMPTDTALGQAAVTVITATGSSPIAFVNISRTAPGIFSANTNGAGVAAALIQRVHADGSQNVENIAAFDPATKLMVAVPVTAGPDTLYLQLYGTGIRYVPDQSLVTCTIGGRAATVLYAGIAPGYFGLDQVNIRIPDGLTGVVNIVVTVDGQVANTVTMTLK